jgi:hypothetical protein
MKRYYTSIIAIAALALNSCDQFVELDSPKTQIVNNKVFVNDAGARAAVSGILSQMMAGSSFASGSINSVTLITGLSSDELNNNSTSQNQITLYNNSLTSVNNSGVSSNWNDMYAFVYSVNSTLEGTAASEGISKPVKDQVVGEARFIRAFSYFYLINLFGDVPLITTTDYRVNRLASRAPMADVYNQVETDLLEAQKLLLDDYSYSGGQKVEPNKWAATALLARTYLYRQKWTDAEAQSAAIIESQKFSLVADLNTVFLKNSSEAIWQLMPVLPGFNTTEGQLFVIASNPTRVSATAAVTNVFEVGDKRAASWIGSFTTGGKTYKFANKYKVRLRDQPITEYYMIFRLAEQYLIRSEARAMLGNLTGAVADINVIRARAGLIPINANGLTQQQVLDAIDHERRAELFIEWGHRWFDLKRTGKIDAVLGAVKPDWQSTDALYPLPQAEINADPNLIQNP